MRFHRIGGLLVGTVTVIGLLTACAEEPAAVNPSGTAASCTKTAPSVTASPSPTAAASSAPTSAAATTTTTAPPAAADSIVTKAKNTGKLVIGVKYDQPGLGLRGADGKVSGFDVEVAKYVAKELGVPETGIEWKETPSAERENALTKSQVDMIFATYSITENRKKVVDFAGPYFVAHQDLLVKKTNTDICGPNNLNGKLLCSVKGSTSAQKIKDSYATGTQLKEYGGYSDCVQALKSGAVDAVTTDDVILAGYAAQSPADMKIVGNGFSNENYGVGLRKGDTDGKKAVNAAILKMQSSGAWKTALDTTVGPSGYVIPSPPAITEN
jgi:glutamate transport system substrate-binding protein